METMRRECPFYHSKNRAYNVFQLCNSANLPRFVIVLAEG